MKLRLLCLCLILVWPFVGHAETLSLADANNDVLLQLSVPSPAGMTDFSEGEYFALLGTDAVYGATDVGFGSSDYFAQFFVAGAFGFDYFNTLDSSQLYSGDEASPTLLAGTYALNSAEGLSYNLTITNDVALAPEPNSMLLCGTGCAVVCCFLVRREEIGKRDRVLA